MLTIESETDLAIDLRSANEFLIRQKDIRTLYGEAPQHDDWQGILAIEGEDFVIASVDDDWWEGVYKDHTQTAITTYDYNDDDVLAVASSFGELSTWQTVSRFIEDGSFIVRYEHENINKRFEIRSGRAKEL